MADRSLFCFSELLAVLVSSLSCDELAAVMSFGIVVLVVDVSLLLCSCLSFCSLFWFFCSFFFAIFSFFFWDFDNLGSV